MAGDMCSDGDMWRGVHGKGACVQERWPLKQAVCILLECILITARKRSLGQGNMFTGVCLSTGGGGCLLLGGAWYRGGGNGACFRWGCQVETPRTATTARGTHPIGMHSCSGVSIWLCS